MKLKKIASLALAGVMAVSMLAGCATNKPDPDPNPGEGQGPVTTTGYSAKLEDAMDLDADKYGYISFKDNTDDQAALEAAMGNLSSDSLENLIDGVSKVVVMQMDESSTWKDVELSMAKFKEYAGLEKDMTMNNGALNFSAKVDTSINPEIRTGVVYVVNGSVDIKEALKQVAVDIDDQMKAAAKQGGKGVIFDYTYTLSASAVTKTLPDSYTGGTNALTFIAVTSTRNATMQK